MTAAQRVASARQYLVYARAVKVADLPYPALVRLAAELRRQLGLVLDVIDDDAGAGRLAAIRAVLARPVSGLAKSIDALYFDYKPVAGHLEGCRFRGTDMWEVTRHAWESFDGERCEETIRLACHECGVVHFRGPGDGVGSFETTHADQVGYAGKPERVAGVWLHPGPRIWYGDDRGPLAYLVTTSKAAPHRPEDVIGKVGWSLGQRGGVRWGAGIGATGHGTVLRASEQTWPSRRAAVAWVVANTGGAS